MSELPELSGVELKLFSLVKEHWPVTSIELAELFNENLASRESRKKAYSRAVHDGKEEKSICTNICFI